MKKIIIYAVSGLLLATIAVASVNAVVDTVPPSTPAGLTATAISSSQINLAWTASTDDVALAGYIIFRNSAPVALTFTNSYNDTGRTAATAYTYTVRALDLAGNLSVDSNTATATTLAITTDTTPPSVPTGLTATAMSASQINLSWTAATDNVGVTGYTILRNGTPVGTAAGTTFNDTGLTVSTAYTYTVKAFDAASNSSADSATATATTLAASGDTTAPSLPTNVIASAISDRQINLIWTASTDNVGVTGYQVFRNGTLIGTATTTSFSDTGLTAATAYSYTVKATDAAGNLSVESAAASATTLAANYKNRGQHDDDDDEDEDEYEEEYESEDDNGHVQIHIHGRGNAQGNAFGLLKNKHHDD